MGTELPAALRVLAPFLKRANQLKKHDPVMAYHCSYYAVQKGLELRESVAPEQRGPVTQALMALLDEMEQDKAQLGSVLQQDKSQLPHALEFALRVFKRADDQDRQGLSNKDTAECFYAASLFLEVCSQFNKPEDGATEALLADIEEKRKYAKWKAADILRCLREGVKPMPGLGGELLPEPQEGGEHPFPTFPLPSNALSKPPSDGNAVRNWNEQGAEHEHGTLFSEVPSFPDIPSSFSALSSTPPPAASVGSNGGTPLNTTATMQDEEEIPLFPTSRDISVNPTPQFPSSSTNSPLPEFDFLSAFPSPPVTAPTAGAPSLSPSSPSPSSSSSPTSSGFFGSAPIQPTQYPSIPSHTSDFSPPSTSLPSSAKTSPAVPRTQPQAQNGPAPCNLDRVSPLPLVGTNSAGGASKGYVPTEENLEAASKFARFAVSALQFEDVPYAISNLQKALAHLTGN